MRQQRLLCAIPGIGKTTADLILAEIDIDNFDDARQLAAYIGIKPQHFESGTLVKKRDTISKQGNARLRCGLYMPAIVAKHYNPACGRLADKQKQGKSSPLSCVSLFIRSMVFSIPGNLLTPILNKLLDF